MNRYLEKIALHQEPVDEILNDHEERHYEIEDALNEHSDDMDNLLDMYRQDAPLDPHRDALANHIKMMRLDKLRDELGLDEQHHENNVVTAKRLMALQGLEHLVDDDNAAHIVGRFENALGSNLSNPSAIWKGLGTAAAVVGGGVLGAKLSHDAFGPGFKVLGGALAGAIGGGYIGGKGLGNILDDRIKSREQRNYDAREDAIESAFTRLQSRYTPV